MIVKLKSEYGPYEYIAFEKAVGYSILKFGTRLCDDDLTLDDMIAASLFLAKKSDIETNHDDIAHDIVANLVDYLKMLCEFLVTFLKEKDDN